MEGDSKKTLEGDDAYNTPALHAGAGMLHKDAGAQERRSAGAQAQGHAHAKINRIPQTPAAVVHPLFIHITILLWINYLIQRPSTLLIL